VIASPDGKTLAMLLRENSRKQQSLISFEDSRGGDLQVATAQDAGVTSSAILSVGGGGFEL